MPILSSIQLDHCGYVVPDLDAAVDFFTTYLGFQLLATHGPLQSDSDDRMMSTYAVPERAVGRSAFLQQGGQKLKFVEWQIYGEGANPLRESSIPGCHIALRTSDLAAALEVLKTIPRMRFLEISPEGFVYCFTPFGFQLQLLEAEYSV